MSYGVLSLFLQGVFPGCPCGYQLQLPSSCKCNNGVINTTPVCPTNYWFFELICECVCNSHAECPTTYKWNNEECGCFCDTEVSCPSYYEWDVSQCKCVCNRLCPYGKVLDNDSCTCVCKETCEECELQNPSNCNCEVFTQLLAAMITSDSSKPVEMMDHKENRKYYEYRRPY